ncbi:type II secretion system protein [Campylobacter sp.]|uniref:type II secretion system protein n=1 Tax=Campylobacter sp. TaxID=205 RepID=UPI0038B25699
MIELIFVIVILGILASVAIPRLAATREDAEISAAVANLRTLVSDATAYYTAKGEFGSNTKWNEITSVPLANANTNSNAVGTAATAKLKAGGKDCIGVHIVNKNGTTPAHIVFTKESGGSVCNQVQSADPIKAYFTSTVNGVETTSGTKGAVAIGSSTSVYGSATQPATGAQKGRTQR